MNWVKLCLHNKVIIYLSALFLALFGIFSLFHSPISPFPSVKINNITITLSYPGANAETVEKQVTDEISANLQSINNIKYIIANTQAGSASFELSLNDASENALLQTQMEIMQAIASVNLPKSVPQPLITREMGTSSLVSYFISSKTHKLFYLSNFILSEMMPYFRALPDVFVWTGDLQGAVQIQLDPEKVAQYRLNPLNIAEMVNHNYATAPLGSLYLAGQTYVLNSDKNFNRLHTLKNMVIAYQRSDANTSKVIRGRPIYLKDIAEVRFAPKITASPPYSSFNGNIAAEIDLLTHANANPFKVSSIASQYAAKLQLQHPNDLKISPTFDMAKIMRTSMHEVIFTIFIAAVLVLLVALVFLGRFRITLIPIITIPVCLLGAASLIYLLGISLNIITLLAMVIAVGLVVDDAIVVVEHITCLIEQGTAKHKAIIEGTSEIATTVIGITLTLLAVYLPILFVGGSIIAIIKPFALTLAASVFISGIIALTLTPVMATALISSKPPNRFQTFFNHFLSVVIHRYHALLKHAFKYPKRILGLFSILLLIGAYSALKLPKEVFPKDPSGIIMVRVSGTAADNTATIKQTLNRFKAFYHIPESDYYAMNISTDPVTGKLRGKLMLHIKDPYLTQNQAIADKLNAFIRKAHIENTYAMMNPFSRSGGDSDIGFYLYGADHNLRVKSAKSITEKMRNNPAFSIVNNTIAAPKKQFAFMIDSVKAARLGISREDISALLSVYYGGFTLDNNFMIDGLSVPVIVQMQSADLQNPKSLEKINITSPLDKKAYPMTAFVTMKLITKPLMIQSFNNKEAIEISANLAHGYSLADGIKQIDQILSLPSNEKLQYHYVDNADDYLESNGQTLWVLIMGVLSIYFLLVVIFRNLIDPLIIMLTVPFSMIGGALSLYLVGGTLNLYSVLGLITLIGLITKHGILIIQFANRELKRHLSVKQAIMNATGLRFRPIMMTTLAMIFGALPLLLSQNIMYVARANLGIVIIGGLVIGTVFSLFIIPMVWLIVKSYRKH